MFLNTQTLKSGHMCPSYQVAFNIYFLSKLLSWCCVVFFFFVCFFEDAMFCPPQSLFVNLCLNLFQVLQCNCSVDTITFPVTVTQQSPATVSMDTYQITMKPMQAQVKYKWNGFASVSLHQSALLHTQLSLVWCLLPLLTWMSFSVCQFFSPSQ